MNFHQHDFKEYWTQTGVIPRWQLVAVYTIIVAIFAFTMTRTTNASQRASELSAQNRVTAKDGRNQTCTLFERQYRNNVRQVTQSYEYVLSLTASERKDTLNVFVIRNLPQTEQTARDTRPPTYCNDPNVGLPGKNPSLPKRPADVDKLLQ